MSKIVTARLPDKTADRFSRYARKRQRSINEVAVWVFEEWIRQQEFAFIEFRETAEGARIPYMKNSRLPVYWIARQAKENDFNAERLLKHYPGRTKDWIQSAINYYEAYPEEIEGQILDYEEESSFDVLKRKYPALIQEKV